MEIIIDTREKTPYELIGAKKAALETGDYSVEGYEDKIAVERKSYGDLYNCLTSSKKHFKKQLDRLSDYDFAYLLIDTTASSVLMGHPHCKLPGEKALSHLAKLSVDYEVPFCFVDNKGPIITRNLLNQAKIKCDAEKKTDGRKIKISELKGIKGIGAKTLKSIKEQLG